MKAEGKTNAGYVTQKMTRDKWLSEKEFVALLTAARNRRHKNAPRDFTILFTAGLAGMRVSEVMDIRASDCARLSDRPHPTLRVRTRKKRKKIFHEVGLPVQAAETLERFVKLMRVTGEAKVFPITRRSAQRIFKRYAGLANLRPVYSFHSLRHFRGVHIYEKTKNLLVVKETLRHSSIAASEVYLHAVELRSQQVEAGVPLFFKDKE